MSKTCLILAATVVGVLLGAADLFPCQCAWKIDCPSLPDTGNANRAVFVGVVTSVSGESLSSKLQRRGWEGEPPGLRHSLGEWEDFMGSYKDSLLNAWRGYLTIEEIEKIRNARNPEDFPQIYLSERVRLRVSEDFRGADGENFELQTGFGYGDCGVPFEVGETFLVYANRVEEGSNRWKTSVCSGTRRINADEQDLRTLRELKAGQQFVPRIYGNLMHYDYDNPDGTPIAGARITLSREGKILKETQTDREGRFLFKGLKNGKYLVDVPSHHFSILNSNSGEKEINLPKSGCADLQLSLEKTQEKTNSGEPSR